MVIMTIGAALGRAIAALREHSDETLGADDFAAMLSELDVEPELAVRVLE
jgi:hypothetical protein